MTPAVSTVVRLIPDEVESLFVGAATLADGLK